ncbi:MAG: IS4 family transposase [Verrucomicrobia bacterium]|nr:IS4 family transposase [Verrucomicrobiota bacterium]
MFYRQPSIPTHQRQHIEDKESYRWLRSYQRSCELSRELPESQLINIADREGDIIEVFAEVTKQKENGCAADIIVRSQYDRLLVKEEGSEQNKLRQNLKKSKSIGEIEFVIPATEKRKGRKVRQSLKGLTVAIKPGNKKLSTKINAVMAIEEYPPEGEEALTWVFITNLSIDTFESVLKVIRYYLCRWEVEVFFKILKSGCKIEERQLQTTDRMKALIAIFMVLAWRVMFTMMLGRVCGEMSCDIVFDESEWKAVYKILNRKKAIPEKPPSLREFIAMVAILGGYTQLASRIGFLPA